MTEVLNIHGHDLVFKKNVGKAVIEIDLAGNLEECFLIDIFSVDEKDYIALLSLESSEVFLFKYIEPIDEVSNEINLSMIENEDELDEVFHLFSHYWTDEKIDELLLEYKEEGSKL